jgi:hypothetical protein
MKQPVERRLAAILAADAAGYSRLKGPTRTQPQPSAGGVTSTGRRPLSPSRSSLNRTRIRSQLCAPPCGTSPEYWALWEKTVAVGLRRASLPDE